MKFEEGDRVRIVASVKFDPSLYGRVGKIVAIHAGPHRNIIHDTDCPPLYAVKLDGAQFKSKIAMQVAIYETELEHENA